MIQRNNSLITTLVWVALSVRIAVSAGLSQEEIYIRSRYTNNRSQESDEIERSKPETVRDGRARKKNHQNITPHLPPGGDHPGPANTGLGLLAPCSGDPGKDPYPPGTPPCRPVRPDLEAGQPGVHRRRGVPRQFFPWCRQSGTLLAGRGGHRCLRETRE